MTKLGQAYSSLGFFKHHKIDYLFDGERYIDFPCFYCGIQVQMDVVTTIWSCESCNNKGNIIKLDELIKRNQKIKKYKIYNPNREREEIVRKLKSAADKYDDTGLENLIGKIDSLLNFHQKKPS